MEERGGSEEEEGVKEGKEDLVEQTGVKVVTLAAITVAMGVRVATLGAITLAMGAKVASEVAMDMETGARVAILQATTGMEVRVETLEATMAMEVRVAILEEEVTALGGTATTGVKEGTSEEATMETGIVSGETVTMGTGVKEGLEEETTEMRIVSEGTATTGTGVREGTLGEATMETGIVSEGTVTMGTTGVRVETLETTETVLGETAIMETEDRVEIADNIH